MAPWHASKHEGGEATWARAKGGSEVCTSSASMCVRLGRVLKNHYICLKEFKISTLIRDITFIRESRNSYVNNASVSQTIQSALWIAHHVVRGATSRRTSSTRFSTTRGDQSPQEQSLDVGVHDPAQVLPVGARSHP